MEFKVRGALDDSLLSLIRDGFTKRNQLFAHRIAIFDMSGRIVGILSQMDVSRHMAAHPQKMGQWWHRTVYELGLLSPKV